MSEVSGKWEKKSFYSEYFYCSECKYAYRHAFNFCPNCGMPMTEKALEMIRNRKRGVIRNEENSNTRSIS